MKAKELMIGDWVLLDKDYPITRIKPARLTLQDFIEQGKECEPIPLTSEILDKNGWEISENQLYYLLKDNDEAFICWYINHHTFHYIQYNSSHINIYVTCDYVHELQNILRMCGLKELADNFKI